MKLPEGGQLDLGAKFTHRPQVVFHTHQARTVLPGSARPAGNTSAGGNRPSFSRPNGAPQRPG